MQFFDVTFTIGEGERKMIMHNIGIGLWLGLHQCSLSLATAAMTFGVFSLCRYWVNSSYLDFIALWENNKLWINHEYLNLTHFEKAESGKSHSFKVSPSHWHYPTGTEQKDWHPMSIIRLMSDYVFKYTQTLTTLW